MDLPSLLIISDDRLTRAGLAAVLSDAANLDVAGNVDSHGDPAQWLELYDPTVLLWDLGWDAEARTGPTSALERLSHATELTLPTVVLLPDDEHALSVWQLGVNGLLPRSANVETVSAAVQAASVDLRVLDAQMARAVTSAPSGDAIALTEPLTPREEEVLALVAEGMTNRAIGHALSISEHTAKFHVQALLGKLGAQSRTEAVVRATRLGLLSL